MEEMWKAQVQIWDTFKNKLINVIYDDHPGPIPKKKTGNFVGISQTHIFIDVNGNPESILLTIIRRVEIAKGGPYDRQKTF